MAKETAEQELARLRSEVAELKATGIKFKVSDKGALSVYFARQRFPVTLYADQWKQIFDAADELQKFMETNSAKLKVRD